MKLGFSLLNNWGIDDAPALVDLACLAEELGVDSVWVHDHVFNVGHVFDRIGGRPYYEPLTLLSRQLKPRPGYVPLVACVPIDDVVIVLLYRLGRTQPRGQIAKLPG